MIAMIQLPMIGTEEQTESSKFQITLVDKTNKSIPPIEYPRTNRFFENLNDRNTFIQMLESAVIQKGGRLVHNVRMSHPCFATFNIFDKQGDIGLEITVYH